MNRSVRGRLSIVAHSPLLTLYHPRDTKYGSPVVSLSAKPIATDMNSSVLLVLFCTLAVPAISQLIACNNANVELLSVAIGFADKLTTGEPYLVSRGWYNINKGECATILNRPLAERYIYFYGKSGSKIWAGTTRFCVSTSIQFICPNDRECVSCGGYCASSLSCTTYYLPFTALFYVRDLGSSTTYSINFVENNGITDVEEIPFAQFPKLPDVAVMSDLKNE